MDSLATEGQPIPLLLMDEADGEWAEDITIDEIFWDIDGFYELEEDVPDETRERVLPKQWVQDYLSHCFNHGVEAFEIDEYWEAIADFVYYIETADQTPEQATEIEGHHLSHYLIEFWDDELGEEETPVEEKLYTLAVLRDLYVYLANHDYIPVPIAQRIDQAVDALTINPDTLTPIPKK
ncbi:MAG: hypothetical protein AAF485_03055 [Chloroflexota bacterium]